MFRRLLTPLLAFAALAAWSRAQPAPATPPLEITLVPTIQYATHDFYAHTPDHAGPEFVKIAFLFQGQGVDLVVLAKNYGVSENGAASLYYDLAITYPNGTTQQAGRDLRLCVERVPNPQFLAYARQVARFSTDPGDPAGNYTFTVTAHDRVTGATGTQSATLKIVPYRYDPAAALLPADFDSLAWMSSYYLHPRPGLALPALLKIADNITKTPDQWPAVLGFYEEVLADNPWLAPSFLARLKTSQGVEKKALSLVLGYALRNSPPQGIDLEKRDWPDVDRGDLGDPMQIDILWGRFWATGSFVPVARIVSLLHRPPSAAAVDGPTASLPVDGAPTPAAMRELVLQSAQWSLSQNARAQPLVRAYCQWLLSLNPPDPIFKSLLTDAIAGTISAPLTPPTTSSSAVSFPTAQ